MKIIGHRGARGLTPENTLASFQKAIDHHVDGIECDVRVTKDGVPVLIHDKRLRDPAGNLLTVGSHNLRELRQHRPDLATLEQGIRAVNRKVPLLLEIKPGEPVEPVVTIIKKFLETGWQAADFTFLSFSFPVLKELKAALPDVSLIVNEGWSGVRATRRARQLGTNKIDINQRWLWSVFIRGMKHSGYELYTFSLNDVAKAKRWQKYGLAAAITDYPDRFEKHHR